MSKFHCKPCDITFTTKNSLQVHEDSAKHFQFVMKKDEIKITDELILEYYSNYCIEHGYYTNDDEKFDIHMNGNLHILSQEENKKRLKEINKDNCKKGDDLEKYFVELYKQDKNINEVKRIGQYGSSYDIILKYKNEKIYKGVQIKLVRKINNISYAISLTGKKLYKNNEDKKIYKYKDDTLIICSDIDHKFFVIIPYSKLKHLSQGTVFTMSKGSDYYQYCYNDFNKFRDDLFKKSNESTEIPDIKKTFSETTLKEYENIQRLEIKCKEWKLNFIDRDTNSTVIDCCINGKNIQCKSSNNFENKMWKFSTQKTVDKQHVPYDETDNIDFFIFEIIDKKYQNNFYIIPKQRMIQEKYVKDINGNGGISSIFIAPPEHIPKIKHLGEHWTLEYINAFDLLGGIPPVNWKPRKFVRGLDGILQRMNLRFEITKKQFCQRSMTSIMDKKIVCRSRNVINSNGCKFTLFHSIYINGKRKQIPYEKGDIDFFIFEISTDEYKENYYIIPENVLIKMGIVGTDNKKGKVNFSLPHPKSKNNWSDKYLNRFNQFKPQSILRKDILVLIKNYVNDENKMKIFLNNLKELKN